MLPPEAIKYGKPYLRWEQSSCSKDSQLFIIIKCKKKFFNAVLTEEFSVMRWLIDISTVNTETQCNWVLFLRLDPRFSLFFKLDTLNPKDIRNFSSTHMCFQINKKQGPTLLSGVDETSLFWCARIALSFKNLKEFHDLGVKEEIILA